MFKIKKHSGPQRLDTCVWDQQLYDLFFSDLKEQDRGHSFGFMLTERDSTLAHGQSVQHSYHGNWRVASYPYEDKYCDILVDLFFDELDDLRIKDTPFGYANFGWRKTKSGQKPTIVMLVRETGKISEEISLLFTETKACGGQGIEVVFNIDINNMLGQDAKAIWGDWESSDDNNLPGRKNFSFDFLKFCANIK